MQTTTAVSDIGATLGGEQYVYATLENAVSKAGAVSVATSL